MIPATFEYHRPSTLQEAVALLGRLGEDAKVLAGGQSLIPLMKLRLASPRHVVDVNRIPGLGAITDPLVRNLATVGGNLAHGDPANDHPAAMLALEAEVTVVGASGSRRIP